MLSTVAWLWLSLCAPAAAEPRVLLDASREGAPLSPLLYGQFIEHVGRGVYGGLWAEMLEDRKFFFPVTDDFSPWSTRTDEEWESGPYPILTGSPWKTVGPPGSVAMDATRPFVGAHSPLVRLAGAEAGIAQPGLALERGRDYVGRIALSATSDSGPLEVRLRLDDGTVLRQEVAAATGAFLTSAFRFRPPASARDAELSVVGSGRGSFRVGAVSLMPGDHLEGWRRDVVERLRELGATVYRWPGGNFASGYDWRDGLGPPDLRAPARNPAWSGVESHDVGLHEFLELTRLLGAEPYICVNLGLGSVALAAQEVEYVNGSTTTAMGLWRASHGRPAPYGVRWWALGNEMHGDWQLGYMKRALFLDKHRDAARAMRAADPSVSLVAVGEIGPWDEAMLAANAGDMAALSEHVYAKERPEPSAHARQLAEVIAEIARLQRAYRRDIPALRGRNVGIALDEWNYWYGPYVYGELGVRYRLKDALGVALGLHELFRHGDLFVMANYAQAVNALGAVKADRTHAALEATALALMLYRRRFGSIPLAVSAQPDGLDVSAAWTADRRALTVAVVNAGPKPRTLRLDWRGPALAGSAAAWTLADDRDDPEAHNDPGRPPRVRLTESRTRFDGRALSLPPYSVRLYRVGRMVE